MEGLELICFEIISSVGMARSLYIEAIQEAKAGNFEQAQGMNPSPRDTIPMQS